MQRPRARMLNPLHGQARATVGGMDVRRDRVPLFERESGPMRLLQIPPAMPLLAILSVRVRVLIDREHPL